MTRLLTSTAEAQRMLEILGNPFVEVRAISPGRICRGYFDDLAAAAATATNMARDDTWTGIYVTINRLSDKLQELALGQMARGRATKDQEIDRLRHLVLDIDPIKPDGIKGAATDAEHQVTLGAAEKAKQVAADSGWPEPMLVDSGNGAYAIFRIELPNNAASKQLLGQVLKTFAVQIGNEGAKVDTSVNNPGRIFRIAGTINRKGEHSDERPHRMARIISAPAEDRLQPVSVDQLRKFVGDMVDIPESSVSSDLLDEVLLDSEQHRQLVNLVTSYLRAAGAPPFVQYAESEFVKLEFTYCPFKGTEHTDGRSAVLVWKSGSIGVKCFHEKCKDKGWQDLQIKLGMDFDDAVAEKFATAGITGQTERAHNDPLLLAQAHVDKYRWSTGEITTACFQGDLWRFDKCDAWQKTSSRELFPWLRATIQNQFDEHARLMSKITGNKRKPTSVRSRDLSDTYRALESLSRREVPVTTQPPFWYDPYEDWHAQELLVFRNGILNVRRYVLEQDSFFIPLTPRLFYEHQASFDFEPKAPAPVAWYEFLDSLEQDDDWVRFLQEMMGYILWSAHDLQKYFVLFGPPRSGKGTITNVLTDLVGGAPAVCSPSLSDFAEPFGLEQAIGKRLAIVPEIDMPEANVRQIVATIKAITGGDTITVNRKHKCNVPLRLPIKIVMLTNHFVALPDNSGALQARFLPLRLTKSFVGQEDIQLAKKLSAENSGILLWALSGAQRLYDAGGVFTLPKSSKDFLEEHLTESAPLQRFVEECCEIDLRKAVQSPALYEIYKKWFNLGRPKEPPLGEETFAAELRTALPSVDKRRMSSANQQSYRSHPIIETEFDCTNARSPLWVGICPRPEWTGLSTSA